jgi:hypothetical protein
MKAVGDQKYCPSCKETKHISNYGANKYTADKLKLYCRQCIKQKRIDNSAHYKEYDKKYYIDHKEELKKYKKQYAIDHPEVIKKYYIDHKEEIIEKRAQKYIEKREVLLETSRIYRINNPEVIKNYRETHREDAALYRKNNKNKSAERSRKRYSEDAYFKFTVNLRNRINGLIKDKKNHSTHLIGCTKDFILKHLQQTAIQNGYYEFDINNWDGKKYHLDHIIPCAAFKDLQEEVQQKLCFEWRNYQMLLSDENSRLRKSDKLPIKIPSRFLPYLKQSYLDGERWEGIKGVEINEHFYEEEPI